MSNFEDSRDQRGDALRRIGQSGRELSTAIVLYHSALSRRIGLSPTEEKVLGLVEKKQSIAVSELAHLAAMPKNTLSDLLDRLQDKGFISRHPSLHDRRQVMIEPTEDGRREIFELFSGLMAALDQVYAEYTVDELLLLSEFQARVAEAQFEQARILEKEQDGDSQVP